MNVSVCLCPKTLILETNKHYCVALFGYGVALNMINHMVCTLAGLNQSIMYLAFYFILKSTGCMWVSLF